MTDWEAKQDKLAALVDAEGAQLEELLVKLPILTGRDALRLAFQHLDAAGRQVLFEAVGKIVEAEGM